MSIKKTNYLVFSRENRILNLRSLWEEVMILEGVFGTFTRKWSLCSSLVNGQVGEVRMPSDERALIGGAASSAFRKCLCLVCSLLCHWKFPSIA